jgi:hypothetical protein
MFLEEGGGPRRDRPLNKRSVVPGVLRGVVRFLGERRNPRGSLSSDFSPEPIYN